MAMRGRSDAATINAESPPTAATPPEEDTTTTATEQAAITAALLARIQDLERGAQKRASSKRRRRDRSSSSSRSSSNSDENPDDPAYLDQEAPKISSRRRDRHMKLEKVYRPAEPKEYSGGNISITREFIRRCEGVFTMQPHVYYYQRDKFNYARSRLTGRVETSWNTQERNIDPAALLWTTLKTWLLDQVQDPNNRSITFMIKLFNHKQRNMQSVDDFATYLEDAEQEVQMEPFTETQRMCLLIAGLAMPLREKLLEQQVIPYTRAELLPLLSRLEQNLNRTNYHRSRMTRRSPPAAQQETKVVVTRPGNDVAPTVSLPRTGPATGVNRIPFGSCFTCGKAGHYSRFCPTKNSRP